MKLKIVSFALTTVLGLLLLITLYIFNKSVPANIASLESENETIKTNLAATTSVSGLYSGPFNLVVTEPKAGVVRIVGSAQFGGYSNQNSATLDATLSVSNNVATYKTPNEDGSLCVLEFRFTDSGLNVFQVEECDVERAVFAKGRLNQEISYVKASN